jgi:hypothetical protein
MTEPEAPKKRLEGSGWWPSVADQEGAKSAAWQGVVAACFVAVVTTLFSVLAMFGFQIVPGFSPTALVDAGLSAIVAWRIYRMSRAWAVVGLLLYVAERAYAFHVRGVKEAAGIFVGVAILLGFVNGVRGNFAYRRLSATQERTSTI